MLIYLFSRYDDQRGAAFKRTVTFLGSLFYWKLKKVFSITYDVSAFDPSGKSLFYFHQIEN